MRQLFILIAVIITMTSAADPTVSHAKADVGSFAIEDSASTGTYFYTDSARVVVDSTFKRTSDSIVVFDKRVAAFGTAKWVYYRPDSPEPFLLVDSDTIVGRWYYTDTLWQDVWEHKHTDSLPNVQITWTGSVNFTLVDADLDSMKVWCHVFADTFDYVGVGEPVEVLSKDILYTGSNSMQIRFTHTHHAWKGYTDCWLEVYADDALYLYRD